MVQTNACKLVHFFSLNKPHPPSCLNNSRVSPLCSMTHYSQLFPRGQIICFLHCCFYNYYFNRRSLFLVPALAQYRVKVAAENHSVTLADHHQTGLSPNQLLAALNASIDSNSSVFNATTGEWVHSQPTEAPHNPADDNNRYRGQLFLLFCLFVCLFLLNILGCMM
jgi:hypothetical protein